MLTETRWKTVSGWWLLVAPLLLAACQNSEPRGVVESGGHAELACVACHQGEAADAGMPAVPRNTCASSACHGQAIPAEVTISTVTFQHRSHGADSEVALGCAGCHTHQTGNDPLTAGVDACGLCHAQDLGGEAGQDCAECHQRPEHVTLTSQGVPVPHEGLPWIDRSCVRCHYDVAEPAHEVPIARCRSCHEDVAATTAEAVGRDLHPDHSGVACVACHEGGSHRIVAMSSAVNLECATCHMQVHGVGSAEIAASGTCSQCHGESHGDQQRILLGLMGHGLDPAPSEKFMDGLVCRSCHVQEPGAPATRATEGSARGCVGCHEPRYATVLRWWNRGLSQREAAVGQYLSGARSTLASGVTDPDTVGALLAEAQEFLDLVRNGGGQHNLRLAHRLFNESLDRAADAYEAAGRTSPQKPLLGRQPSMGLCSYCHYRLDDPMDLREMPEDFHVRVMNR